MLTIDGLAERWGVSVANAKRIVRDERVPYLALRRPGPGSMRLCWKFIRFEPDAVAAWEAGRRMAFRRPTPDPVPVGVGRPILRRL